MGTPEGIFLATRAEHTLAGQHDEDKAPTRQGYQTPKQISA
jgi:hypothetical protein